MDQHKLEWKEEGFEMKKSRPVSRGENEKRGEGDKTEPENMTRLIEFDSPLRLTAMAFPVISRHDFIFILFFLVDQILDFRLGISRGGGAKITINEFFQLFDRNRTTRDRPQPKDTDGEN